MMVNSSGSAAPTDTSVAIASKSFFPSLLTWIAIFDAEKATSLSRQTIYRIKDDPAAAEAALATWGA